MQKGKLNVVLDLQWGSTGKGKLAGYLALNEDVDVATCDFQTNAGHTVVMDDGLSYVLQQLPVAAIINKDIKLLINPGASITVSKILEEIDTHGVEKQLKIHPHAAIITLYAVEWEQENLKRISSTLKGVGATLGLKAMRDPRVVLAKDEPKLRPFIADTTEILHRYLKAGAMCIAEGAQGFDLSLNHGHEYPYVTGRDVTTCSILSNAGVAPQLVGDVYGCLRTFPIRVGHQIENGVKVGDSGPIYSDQMEMSWEELSRACGAPNSFSETTTVTGKIRRVFTFSHKQLKRSMMSCMPTHLFVNFINYVNYEDSCIRSWSELSERSRRFLARIEETAAEVEYRGISKAKISHVGSGPQMSQMVELA